MHKFGLAIHLQDFAGDVTLKGNAFTGTRLNFNDFCYLHEDPASEDYSMTWTPPGGAASLWTLPSSLAAANSVTKFKDMVVNQNDAHQLHSLILIDNLPDDKSIQIEENTFKGNTVTNGLISIS